MKETYISTHILSTPNGNLYYSAVRQWKEEDWKLDPVLYRTEDFDTFDEAYFDANRWMNEQ